MSKHRTSLSLAQKIRVIELSDARKSSREIVDYLKKDSVTVSKSAINNVLKRRSEVLQAAEKNVPSCSKRLRFSSADEEHRRLDNFVYEWFLCAREKGFPISGPVLQAKALEFAEANKISSFKASNGWLMRFQDRHNLKSRLIVGEEGDVQSQTIESWKSTLPLICKDFREEDIFNGDEFGLFWRGLPSRSMVEKGKKAVGGKMSKERISVFVCASQTGEKMKPIVIGKFENPRCFKNIKKDKLPIIWKANSRAWMTEEIFTAYLLARNAELKRQGRKILLFVDNCRAHTDIKLSNIVLQFLPANTTATLQPMDAGVIKNIKGLYRKHLMHLLLRKMETCEKVSDLTKEISVADAVRILAQSWSEVKSETISNCFRHCFFPVNASSGAPELSCDSEMQEDFNSAVKDLNIADPIPYEEFVSFDDAISPTQNFGDNWEEELMHRMSLSTVSSEDQSTDDDDDSENSTARELYSHKEAAKVLERLGEYFAAKQPELHPIYRDLQTKFDASYASSAHQTVITDFFTT